MPVYERRQHFRIDDHIYFEYKLLEPGNCYSDNEVSQDLLHHGEKVYLETRQYFEELDTELSKLTRTLATETPAIAHYLNILNTKINYVAQQITLGEKSAPHKVNISLGGMAFKSKERLKEKARLKLVIYTKPKMIPIIINSIVVHSQYLNSVCYRTAVQFEGLTSEQEQLLSQHIMLAQVQSNTNA